MLFSVLNFKFEAQGLWYRVERTVIRAWGLWLRLLMVHGFGSDLRGEG